MFEDVNKDGKQTAPAGTQEPIDIFSEADAGAPAPGEIMEEGVKAGGFPMKIVAIIVGAVVAVGVIGAGVYFFALKKPAVPPIPLEEPVSEDQQAEEETFTEEEPALEDQQGEQPAELPTGEATPTQDQASQQTLPLPLVDPAPLVPIQAAPLADADGDGLSDEEETKYGTDRNVVDTDNDGLSDREEILVYKINPLNPDTDSDGFADGAEIKNGYNPNGSGKLITLPPEQPAAPAPTQP